MQLRILLLLLLSWNISFTQSQGSKSKTYEFKNGLWYNGKGFIKATWYSINGKLSSARPPKIDSVIDLNKGFVIPPFGEAHNHNVGYTDQFYQLSHKYLRAGIFYVQVPNNFLEGRDKLTAAGTINQDTTIDATFANGGITGYKGHPFFIVQRNIQAGNMTEKEGEGNFYHTVRSLEELETKWPVIIKANPDFIKTYLLFSEEYEKRSNDSNYVGQRGLDPKLLPAIVMKAHKFGLRVAVHVETAMDFHCAVAAGVDEIVHIPGFRGDPMHNALDGLSQLKYPLTIFQIGKEDAKLAARKGISVITTLSGILQVKSPLDKRIADSLFKINLRTLKKAGVKIALGSDAYRGDSWWEIEYLATTGIFTNAELLTMFCHTTPAAIFPKRKIAELRDGFEASFLVLKDNPLIQLIKPGEILFALKQGTILKTIY